MTIRRGSATTSRAPNQGIKRRNRDQAPLYIQVAHDERVRVPERHLTSQIRTCLEEAMRNGQEPTAQNLIDAARVFDEDDDARRQTLWVSTELRNWVRGIASARRVPMTEVIRAMCPGVFCADKPELLRVADGAQVV